MGILDSLFGKHNTEEKKQEDKEQQLLLQTTELLPGLNIPNAFAPYKDAILATALPFIDIEATPAEYIGFRQSKYGHFPCLPVGFPYPLDAEGNYMYPLAQLNFSELPPLPGYPASGYLQFYIATQEIYGLDFDDPQSQANFRVLYFTEDQVEKHIEDFSFLHELLEDNTGPVECPHVLKCTAETEFLGIGDTRYEDLGTFKIDTVLEQHPAIADQLDEFVWENFQSTGDKVGGYAFFTQWDPRSGVDKFKDYILLLQIDSSDKVMWGDVGVGNFFIHPDDLAKRDFTRVLYNWDCH